MNEYDMEVMVGIFMVFGYEVINLVDDVNVILLNICVIWENVENKVFGEFGYLKVFKKNNLDLILGVCGCML